MIWQESARLKTEHATGWKLSKYGVFSGLIFPYSHWMLVSRIRIYSVNLYIDSKYGKLGTRKNFALGNSSHNNNNMQGLIHLHNHYIPIYSLRQYISVYKYTVTRQNLISQSHSKPCQMFEYFEVVKKFCKKFHLRYLTGFGIRLSILMLFTLWLCILSLNLIWNRVRLDYL